jgi:hypothetical protein
LRDEPREYALRELVQIQNYDRLLMIKRKWWSQDHGSTAGTNAL